MLVVILVSALCERKIGLVFGNLVNPPKVRKLESPRAVPVGLFNLNQHPLEVLGIVVSFVKRKLDVLAFQFLFVDDADLAVNPDGVIDAGDEED
jgi:hypothetical protein